MATDETGLFSGGIAIGAVLVVLGIAAYVGTGFASITALIPAIFGVALVVLGWIGRSTGRRRAVAYGYGLLGLVGVAGSTRGLTDVWTLATGGSVDSPIAAGSQAVMVVLCIGLLFLVGRSLGDDR
ncbi:hypothetical protein [Natronococcus occultus]|uniref:Major facilitator superfamily (MFS) profile domain-containing protein n=1 Tax=Natronococcus occultus SP4 TaxID=694430 RepID=L0K157_9EURY|nr:hypothetical protein [Natronococcus occultus]AGB38094.1 hypothetical protein Natoc_2318 [Natronococcus occultus SP4]